MDPKGNTASQNITFQIYRTSSPFYVVRSPQYVRVTNTGSYSFGSLLPGVTSSIPLSLTTMDAILSQYSFTNCYFQTTIGFGNTSGNIRFGLVDITYINGIKFYTDGSSQTIGIQKTISSVSTSLTFISGSISLSISPTDILSMVLKDGIVNIFQDTGNGPTKVAGPIDLPITEYYAIFRSATGVNVTGRYDFTNIQFSAA